VRRLVVDAGIAVLAQNTVTSIFVFGIAIFIEIPHQRLGYSLAVLADLALTVRLEVAADTIELLLFQLLWLLALMGTVDAKSVLVVVMRYALNQLKIEQWLLCPVEKVHPDMRQEAIAWMYMAPITLAPLAQHDKHDQFAIIRNFVE